MPMIRINAVGEQIVQHDGLPCSQDMVARMARGSGPVIVMVHGYKYLPGSPNHCPHNHIFSLATPGRLQPGWPGMLGFGTGRADEGLGIAFGWSSRGSLWQACRRAAEAGRGLGWFLDSLHAAAPDRPLHLIAHSLGIEPVLEALHHLRAGAVSRVVSLTGAAYRSRVARALSTPAGRQTCFVNITTRENDVFDFLFETLVPSQVPGDRTIGVGLESPNATTVQIDCPLTLASLTRLGFVVDPPTRRMCHWSAYTRPGLLTFYRELLRNPDDLTIEALRAAVPPKPAQRWSRLFPRPGFAIPLPFVAKPG